MLEETISVMQRLGQRYLWVDSFCIVQKDIVVKREQILFVGENAQGDFATIVAVSKKSVDA